MKLQTIAMILLVATLASAAPGLLLKSLIKKKLLALAGVKAALVSPAVSGTSFSFAGRLDTVAAPAAVVHVDTVAAPASVVQVNTVAAPAPVVHVNTVVAPAPVVHVNTVVAPAPVVHVNTVHAPAPVVHLDTIHVAEPVYQYAPYHKTPVYYKEVHPASQSIYVGGEVHTTTIGDSHSGSVHAAGDIGLDIRVDDEDSSSGSATAQFNYASAY